MGKQAALASPLFRTFPACLSVLSTQISHFSANTYAHVLCINLGGVTSFDSHALSRYPRPNLPRALPAALSPALTLILTRLPLC